MTKPRLSLIVISLRLYLKKVIFSEVSVTIKAARFLCQSFSSGLRKREIIHRPLREAIRSNRVGLCVSNADTQLNYANEQKHMCLRRLYVGFASGRKYV